jgi:hypothetical protein
MTIYDDAQAIASEVLAEFKQGVIQYVRVTPGTGPVDNPGPSTETVFTLDAVARGAKFKYVQGGLALASDTQITAAAHAALVADYDPTAKVMKGFVTLDGVRYKIVRAIRKPDAGTAVCFILFARK